MRLASGTVLGLAAVASSPALWEGLVTRELPVDLALTRYLATALAVWVGLSVLAYVVGAPAAPVAALAKASPPADDPPAGEPTDGTAARPSGPAAG
jgi:hypothetical protein